MAVTELICPSCGEHNSAGTQFCTSCNTYLAWEMNTAAAGANGTAALVGSAQLQRAQPPAEGLPAAQQPPASRPSPADERTTVLRPPPRPVSAADMTAAATSIPAAPIPVQSVRVPTRTPPPPVQLFRAVIEPAAVTVTPGGVPAAVSVQVFNLFSVVDGFTVELVSPPAFLKVDPVLVRLLPNTDETIELTLGLPLTPMVAAGVHQLTIAVRSSTHLGVTFTAPVTLTVGVIDGPIALSLEPSLIRAKDTESAQSRLVAENLSGNRPVPLTLDGTDPEGLVRFTFAPSVLTVPAGGTATAVVRLSAPLPDPGQQVSRAITLTAADGTREMTVSGTFAQAAAPREVRLSLEPSVVKIRDSGWAQLRLLAENPGGTQPIRLTLRASDPEHAVRFTFNPPVLLIPPGGMAASGIRLEAPEPEPGQEITRALTISAGDGRDTVSVTGTLTQIASPLALSVRLEPSLVRVRDNVFGQTQVVADNRASRRPLRLVLGGSDPERVVQFTFNPPVLVVGPGEIAAAHLLLQAPLPDDGQETSRPITIRATAGDRIVDTAGTYLQSSSAPAISALTLRLDPSVVRVRDSADAWLDVVGDNREGAAPVRVFLDGSDPERLVQFVFDPQVLDIPPGGWALSRVRVRAPRPEQGQEATRQIRVTASDERRTVEATGSYIQTSSDRRPLIRTVLTTAGVTLMSAGTFLPWTTSPDRLSGMQWSLLKFGEAVHLDLAKININVPQLRQVTGAFQSAGLVVLLLAALTVFGLTGSKGRLIRTGSALALLFVVAFSIALMVRADSWAAGIGAILVVLGAATAFVGGLFARR